MNWCDFLEYQDGKVYWKQPASKKSRVKVGEEAGSFEPSTGRYSVCVAGKRTMRSRVIWEMHNGPIPAGMEVDHEDRNKTNDDISNLRLCNASHNNANRTLKLPPCGYRGVEATGKRWRAKVAKKKVGTYDDPMTAALMYNVAAFEKWGTFAELNLVVIQ